MAGLASTKWGPSSRHIITVSSFNLRMTVWSLEDKSVQYIPYPKHKGSQGIAFSPNKQLMALVCAPQEDNGETIGIYDIT